MKISTIKSFFLLFVFYINTINGQTIDVFYKKKLANIEEDYINLNKTDKIATSNAYLSRAKKDKNSIKIANGYYLKTLAHSHSKIALVYADSIIKASTPLKDKTILAKGYLQKGVQNYYQSQYNKALDNYIIAKKYFEKTNSRIGILTVRHYIGALKSVSFKLDESLHIFKSNFKYLESNNLDTLYRSQYLRSLLSLSISYSRNEILDSAEVYFLKGIKETKNGDEYLYSHFLAGYGANSYLKKDYNTTIDNFKKASYFFKDKRNSLTNAYLYIYESYLELGKQDLGLKYLHKVDSIYKIDSTIILNARDTYELLKDYYRDKNDQKKQLEYQSKYITVDSIIDNNLEDLNDKVIRKYEIPELLSNKEKVIYNLEEKNDLKIKILFILMALIITILFLFFRSYKKNKLYKVKFNKLIIDSKETKKSSIYEETITKASANNEISDEIVKSILIKLTNFEASNKFTKKYSLSSLSKELKTNSSYLSKIINSSKETNFSNYLNNLRIDYSVKKLQEDKIFRSYTIKAISEEVGFNTSQSFTNAFYKKTGIYPSFFIKSLNKDKKG